MNVLVAVIGGEHDYPGVGELVENRSGRGKPVHDRHAEIHQDDVGTKFAILLECFLTVRRLTDHLQIGFGREECHETGADEWMVVGGEDPDGRRAGHPDDDIAFFQIRHMAKEVRRTGT